MLTRELTLPAGHPHLIAEVAADGGRAWELSIFVDNQEFSKQTIASAPKQVEWRTVDTDLTAYAGRKVTLRLYQNFETLKPSPPPSVARWKSLTVK